MGKFSVIPYNRGVRNSTMAQRKRVPTKRKRKASKKSVPRKKSRVSNIQDIVAAHIANIYTRTKKAATDENGDHNDMDRQAFKNTLVPKGIKATSNKYNYRVTKQKINNGLQGIQGVFLGYPILMKDHMAGSKNAAATAEQFPDDIFELNLSNTTANDIYNTGTFGFVKKTDVMGIKKVGHEMNILNMANSPAEIVIMYLLCVNDTTENPVTCWTNSVTAGAENQASATIRNLLSTVGAGYGKDDYQSYGAMPNYKKFKQTWKTIAQERFVLQGGNQKKLFTTFNYQKIIRRDVVLQSDAFMAGYTIYPLIIHRGGLIGVANELGADSAEVTNGSTRIGILQKDDYLFCGVPDKAHSAQRRVVGNIINSAYVEKHVDDEDQVDDVEKM